MKINIHNLLGENQRLKIIGNNGAVITPPETTVNPTLGVDDNVLSVCLSPHVISCDGATNQITINPDLDYGALIGFWDNEVGTRAPDIRWDVKVDGILYPLQAGRVGNTDDYLYLEEAIMANLTLAELMDATYIEEGFNLKNKSQEDVRIELIPSSKPTGNMAELTLNPCFTIDEVTGVISVCLAGLTGLECMNNPIFYDQYSTRKGSEYFEPCLFTLNVDGVDYTTSAQHDDAVYALMEIAGTYGSTLINTLIFTTSSDNNWVVTMHNQTGRCLPIQLTDQRGVVYIGDFLGVNLHGAVVQYGTSYSGIPFTPHEDMYWSLRYKLNDGPEQEWNDTFDVAATAYDVFERFAQYLNENSGLPHLVFNIGVNSSDAWFSTSGGSIYGANPYTQAAVPSDPLGIEFIPGAGGYDFVQLCMNGTGFTNRNEHYIYSNAVVTYDGSDS